VQYYFLLFLMSYRALKYKRSGKSRKKLNFLTVSIFYALLLSYYNVVKSNVPIKRAQTQAGNDDFSFVPGLSVSAEILKRLSTLVSRKYKVTTSVHCLQIRKHADIEVIH
jgi:hypothetical protein